GRAGPSSPRGSWVQPAEQLGRRAPPPGWPRVLAEVRCQAALSSRAGCGQRRQAAPPTTPAWEGEQGGAGDPASPGRRPAAGGPRRSEGGGAGARAPRGRRPAGGSPPSEQGGVGDPAPPGLWVAVADPARPGLRVAVADPAPPELRVAVADPTRPGLRLAAAD